VTKGWAWLGADTGNKVGKSHYLTYQPWQGNCTLEANAVISSSIADKLASSAGKDWGKDNKKLKVSGWYRIY